MMFGIQDLGLFVVSGLLLNMVPGPDSLLIMASSGSRGWRAGSAAALGVGTGTFVHVFAAALGLSALLAASAIAFTLVKLAGAAYLVFVGIGLLFGRGRSSGGDTTAPVAPHLRTLFRRGFLTNVLNPKVAVFFLAFVPQFIAADAPNKALAFIVLGAIFNFNSMLWAHLLVFATASASRRLRVSAGAARGLNRVVGAVFVSFGVRLAWAEAR